MERVSAIGARRIFSRGGQIHRRGQRFSHHELTTYLVVALKIQANTTK